MQSNHVITLAFTNNAAEDYYDSEARYTIELYEE